MNMPVNLPVVLQKPSKAPGNTANGKDNSSGFGTMLASAQQSNEKGQGASVETGSKDTAVLADGLIPVSVMAMLQSMIAVAPKTEVSIKEPVAENVVSAIGQTSGQTTGVSPLDLIKTITEAADKGQQLQQAVSATGSPNMVGGQMGQANDQTTTNPQTQTQTVTGLPGLEILKQPAVQPQENMLTNPATSDSIQMQSDQRTPPQETPLSQVVNAAANPVVIATANSTKSAGDKKPNANVTSVSSLETEPDSNNQKSVTPGQIVPVKNPEAGENKDFSGSTFLNDMAQKQTLSNPASQSLGDNTVITPFHAQVENKLSTNHAEAASTSQNNLPAAQDKYDVASQIVEQARTIFRSNNTEMVIRLKPEHLGELTFKVAVENGVVSANFLSNNAEVRGAIEASLPQLKQDLANQGIKLDNVGVFAGMEQFLSGDQRGEQQYQQQFTAGKKSYDDSAENAQEISALTSLENAADSGVDYKV